MDNLLWGYGKNVATLRNHLRHPWELDVLRGMHQQPALNALAVYLGTTTGQPIRLTSIWMDKQVWVSWKDRNGINKTNKELADLAVVVRRKHNGKMHRWMWIAQAKSNSRMLAPYRGGSSANEIDLLHRMPPFQLANVAAPFDLLSDFRTPVSTGLPWNRQALVPWTFLDFDKDPLDPASAKQKGVSPIAARWPAKKPDAADWATSTAVAAGITQRGLASYSECLQAMISNQAVNWYGSNYGYCNFIPGAPIDPKYPQWSRLYYHLLLQNRAAKNGHASVLQGQQEDVIHISQMIANSPLLFSHSEEYYWPHYKHLLRSIGKSERDVAHSLSSFNISRTDINKFDLLCRDSEPESPGGDIPHTKIPPVSENPKGGMQFLIVDVIQAD